MNAANPNLPLLESVVAALGPLCPRFVFVGGCITGLLVTDGASPSVRATRDVDAIVQVVSLGEYHVPPTRLSQRTRSRESSRGLDRLRLKSVRIL